MPFLAIAVAVSIFLGSSVYAATHTEVGAQAAHDVVEAFNNVKADTESRISGSADVDTDLSSDPEVETSAQSDSQVNAETDAGASVSAKDSLDLRSALNAKVDL